MAENDNKAESDGGRTGQEKLKHDAAKPKNGQAMR